MEEVFILLYAKKITSVQQILPSLDFIARTGKPLLIVADYIEGAAIVIVGWMVASKPRLTLLVLISVLLEIKFRRLQIAPSIFLFYCPLLMFHSSPKVLECAGALVANFH